MAETAFTCGYCGYKFTADYGGGIVHKTVSSCRRCSPLSAKVGGQVRLTRFARNPDWHSAAVALQPGDLYTIVCVRQEQHARYFSVVAPDGRTRSFNCLAFEPAEFIFNGV